jgi:hypothetical protein
MIEVGLDVKRGTGGVFALSRLDLGYWNIAAIAGNESDGFSSGIVSPIGGGSLSPVNAPVIDDVAIGGRRALLTSNVDGSYLRYDALASRFTIGNGWTVAIRTRVTSSATDMPLICAGKSSDAVNDNFRILQGQLGSIKIVSRTAAGGLITRVTANGLTHFDEHVIAVTCSPGGVLTVYIDAVPVVLDNSAMDPNALTCDRFALGAFLSTAATAGDSYIQWFGAASTEFGQTDITNLTALLYAQDALAPVASRPEFAWTGDSLTNGSAGVGIGGFRRKFQQWIVDHGLSIRSPGHRAFGVMPQRLSYSQGGNALLTIAGEFANNIGSARPRLVWFLGGTNNQTLQTTAQALADYDSALATEEAAAVAANPAAQIIVSTIPAFDSAVAPTAAANEPNFNTALPARWNAYDAAHPTRPLIRAAVRTYVGPYNAAYYVDETHLNDAGDQLVANGLFQDIGPAVRAVSPTIVPLTCRIKQPAASAVLNVGTPYTVSGRVSRYPSTVTVKLGATVLGSATMNKRDWTFSYTPVSGEIGAQTINATATDTLDSSTANAAGVAVTVQVPVYSPADEGNAVGKWDVSDATGRTVDGSNNLTGLKNLITGINATEATAPPSFVDAGGPDGVLPRATFVGASSQKLLSPADSTYGTALSGDDHPRTFILAFRPTSVAFGTAGFFYSAVNALQVLGVGQGSANYRVYKNPDSNTGSVNQQSLAMVSGWQILQVSFDGTAKQVTTRVNNGTPVTSAFDTTTQTITKWAFGCLGGSFPAIFGSFDLLEAWEFSDNKLGAGVSGGKDAIDRVFNYLNTKWGIGLTAR